MSDSPDYAGGVASTLLLGVDLQPTFLSIIDRKSVV